jgi:hypothetical protein
MAQRAAPPLPDKPIEIPPAPAFPEQHNPGMEESESPDSLEEELKKNFPMPNIDRTEPIVPCEPDMPWTDPKPPFADA